MSEVLRLENVCKSFGSRPVVKNVSFSAVSYTHLTLPTKLEV